MPDNSRYWDTAVNKTRGCLPWTLHSSGDRQTINKSVNYGVFYKVVSTTGQRKIRVTQVIRSEAWRGSVSEKVTFEQSLAQVQGAGYGGRGEGRLTAQVQQRNGETSVAGAGRARASWGGPCRPLRGLWLLFPVKWGTIAGFSAGE